MEKITKYFKGKERIKSFLSLSKLDAESFINEYQGRLFIDLSNLRKAYKFPNQNIFFLDFSYEDFYLFNSELDYHEYFTFIGTPISVLNEYGNNYINNIPNLISKLSDNLSIDMQMLDKSEASLRLIEQKIPFCEVESMFYIKNILSLTAYLGESIISNARIECSWEVKNDLNPIIVTRYGDQINVFDEINNDFHSDERIDFELPVSLMGKFKKNIRRLQ